MRADRRLIASARGRAFLLGLEFCDRGADRRERPVFVLLLAAPCGMLKWRKFAAVIRRAIPAPSLKLSPPHSGGTM
jgi:hypothetical protein